MWNKEESLVVIHAGLQDIAELGQTPEESARELKKRLSEWIGKSPQNRILIYALPETHSEEQLKTACGQWNSSVHQVHEKRYNARTAELLGQRLGKRLRAFLGIPAEGTPRHIRRQEWQPWGNPHAARPLWKHWARHCSKWGCSRGGGVRQDGPSRREKERAGGQEVCWDVQEHTTHRKTEENTQETGP